MKPLISVCMPNYNYENFIGEAIESVISQTYKKIELIIGDDASTDGSMEVIKSFIDPRIKFFQNEQNLYMFPNINKCLSRAKGELIAVLHSDDKYEQNFLEEVVKTYRKYPDNKVFVSGVYFHHYVDNHHIPWHPYKLGGLKSKEEVLIRLSQQNNIGNGVNVVFHRDCLSEVGLFNPEYKSIADFDYLMRLANKYDFVYIPKILTYYRLHSTNSTYKHIKMPERYEDGKKICDKNLYNSNIIPKKLHKPIYYIGTRTRIHRTFNMSTKLNSGETLRFILNQSKRIYPDLKSEPYWYLIYIISYLISSKFKGISTRLASYTGRLLLLPNKVYLNYLLERTIMKANSTR